MIYVSKYSSYTEMRKRIEKRERKEEERKKQKRYTYSMQRFFNVNKPNDLLAYPSEQLFHSWADEIKAAHSFPKKRKRKLFAQICQ